MLHLTTMSLKLSVLGLLLSVLRISTLCRLIALTFTSWMRLGILHVIVLCLYTKQLYALQCNVKIPAVGIQLQQAKLSLLQ